MHNIFKWMIVYQKCYISIELTFLKGLMLIKQVYQDIAIFVTIGIYKIKALRFSQKSAIDVMIY